MKPSALLLSLSASMPFFRGGPRGGRRASSAVCFVRSFSSNLPPPPRVPRGVVEGTVPLLRRRRRRRRVEAASADDDAATTTPYAINDDVCPPTDPNHLRRIVRKHCDTLDTYLSNRPIAKHTSRAFESISSKVDGGKGIVLDSGCGTGRSTLLLGEKYPDATVIGVDRSFVRLNRNVAKNEADCDDEEEDDDVVCRRPFRATSSAVSNALLVRAELTDFWRCCLDSSWEIERHYLLYPNPYPKKNRLKKRFYAHPSFPLLLALGGEEIVVRSNWLGYLDEFARSVIYADEYYRERQQEEERLRRRFSGSGAGAPGEMRTIENWAGPYVESASKGPFERTDKRIAWTNFEKKYDDVGEPTYELSLRRRTAADADA